MKITNPTIKDILRSYVEISLLNKTKAVLDWDLNVNLPPKGAEERSRQTGYLAELITAKWLSPEFKKLIEKAEKIKPVLSAEEKAILRNIRIGTKFYYSVPKNLIVKKEETSSKAFMAWREAKEKNEFSIFKPFLKELISIDKLIAEHLTYKENMYDALLDQFEPGLTTKKAGEAFSAIKPTLITLTKAIQKSKGYSSTSEYVESAKSYPKTEQERLATYVMKKMGFDLMSGRLDISPHPFTTALGQHDIRITNMYKDNDFRDSYISTMHETGHALYEQGIDPEYSTTPLEGGVSYGIHEALSRFWENMIGKNPVFLEFMLPLFQSFYPKELGELDLKTLQKTINLVKPSYVRIESDEVTYSLHIILRFEIENDLLNGKIKVDDAPEVWNEKTKKYFGSVPPNDRDGILQDVHWAYGAFGYFPSYALGNLYGAQFLRKMKKEIAFEKELRLGNLLPIKGWLDQNIHCHGSLLMPHDLMKKVTGESLNPTYFIDYLKEKYVNLYDLNPKSL